VARKLEKAEWRRFFDHLSKQLIGKQAEIEVAALALGVQKEAEWLPLIGIVYDPKSDMIEIALEGLDHAIRAPREVYVEDQAGPLAAIEVINAEDIREIVRLRDPLFLPPPRH
jgi:hypothetical protein